MQQYLTVEPMGVIKDERDAVGEVHLGIACKLTPHDGVDISISAENAENIRSSYVKYPPVLHAMVQSGEITPEGWTSLVVDNELRINSK